MNLGGNSVDTHRHLARLFVLALGGSDPVVDKFYTPRWSIIPDLGIDLIGPPLLQVLPVHVAGRVLIGLVLLLPVLGAVAYSQALLGRRSWWSLGCGLVAYHQTFMLGFLNFTAGMGLALLLAAVWLRDRELHPRRTVVLTALGCVGLYLCHLMGVVFLGILIAAHELAWLSQSYRSHLITPRALLIRFSAAASAFVVPLAFYAGSALSREAGRLTYLTAQGKLAQLVVPWTNYLLPLDIATACATVGAIGFLLVRRQMQIPRQAAIAFMLLGVLYLACPFAYAGVANVDMRFVVLAGFMLFAGLAPVRVPTWLASVMVGLFLVRMGVVAMAWLAIDRRGVAPTLVGSPLSQISRSNCSHWLAPQLGQGRKNRRRSEARYSRSIRERPALGGVETRKAVRRHPTVRARASARAIGSPSPSTSPG